MVNINTNNGALMAAKSVRLIQRNVDNAALRLSSGLRVNSSSDDAAGLAVANKMVSQIRGMETALKNTSDGVSLLQSAIAGMQNSLEITQRMRELAIQSHNGVYSNDDRQIMQSEIDELLGELNRIATYTKFNDVNLLDGSYDQFMRVGNTNPEVVRVTIDGMGINKHIEGTSYAGGSSTQILSPLEFATGTSDFDLPATSTASAEMLPRYLATATASGTSSFSLPASSNAATLSSTPSYLAEATGSGTSQYNVVANSSATGSSTPFYQTFTNAEIRNSSVVSSTSRFTTVGFQNGNFADGTATMSGNVASIPGWDIYFEQPELDGDPYTIGGFQVPTDSSVPHGGNESQATQFLNSGRITNPDLSALVRDNALYLEQGGYNHTSFGVVRGPYVISQDAIALETGDQVSFKWFGLSGGDAYDVYGYLLNEDDGSTIELLNETATLSYQSTQSMGLGDDGWITSSANVSADGNYKFVFIAGSYDRTGGLYLGNGLAIKDVDVIQANPPSVTELTASVTVQAVESNQVRISSTLLGSATSTIASNPGGVWSIISEGSDHAKFTIDPNTGNIISNQQLRYNDQASYKFKVLYTSPGGVTHTETVNLNLTPQDEAFTTVTAIESGQVSFNQDQFATFNDFVNFEATRNMGHLISYRLESYSDNDGNPANDGNPNDFLKFSIDPSTGNISSIGGLDFSVQETYQFNAIATAADGRTFTNHVILNLTDTLDSSAVFQVEETDRVVINISDLSSSSDFASRHPGGTFSVPASGKDNALFSIVGNQIIANNNFRLPVQNSYNLDLIYTVGGIQHTEQIQLDLSRFLQSDSNVTALESNRINISIADLTHVNDFAFDDGYNGSWRLERYDNSDGNPANDGDADDYLQFAIDPDTLTVFSRTPLDYTIEDEFHFNLVYQASDGTEFTDRVILNLQDTLFSSAHMEVEEADQMVINIADLTASSTYSTLNPGGIFSIGAGNELFRVQGNQIIADKEFRKEEQSTYNFELLYTHGGITHTESVRVDLTRFMQSSGTFTADEANKVILNGSSFTHLDDFVSANTGGYYQLSGPDGGLFKVNTSGDVYSINPLDYDVQNTYRFNLDYTISGKTFSSEITLGLQDTFSGKSTLSAEEAQKIIVQGNLFTSLQAYAAKDGNAGSFELLEQGDYDKFTMATDGTLTSKGELRMADDEVLDLYIRYNSNTIADFVEHVQISLTPTSYDHSRSLYQASESGSVVIVPQLNQFLTAYAEADNYAGTFELAQSPYTTDKDHIQFEIDNSGQINSVGRMDFESGRTEYEITVYYNHSSGTKRYTDYRRLEITNDKRDDNNLALEGIDITTREKAASAAELLNEIIVRISASQAKLGAIENRFTHNIDNLSMNILMAEQANGRILDADYAYESTRLARSQILEQAATDMLVKSNQAKQNLLMLIN